MCFRNYAILENIPWPEVTTTLNPTAQSKQNSPTPSKNFEPEDIFNKLDHPDSSRDYLLHTEVQSAVETEFATIYLHTDHKSADEMEYTAVYSSN